MSLQSDLIAKLEALDTAAGVKVYDEQVPQGAPLPFIAITELSGTRPLDLSGAGLLKRSTMRVAAFATSAVDRDAIADAIKAIAPGGLHAFKGQMGDTNVSSIRVEPSSSEVSLSDGDKLIKGKGLDLFIVYY